MKKPYIIGISGGSGSGKTTFIKALTSAFSKAELCLISQDNYYRPREEQFMDSEGKRNFDLPSSLYREEFHRDILKLLNGEKVDRVKYTFNNKEAEESIISFSPAPVIILEGLFIFHYEEIFNLTDLKLFIEVRDDLKVIRRINRDQKERNYPIDDVMYRYENHVAPAFQKYILPYKDEVDLIVNNNSRFDQAIDIIKAFIAKKVNV